MTGRVLAVCVSGGGLPKAAVEGAVAVSASGVAGDAQRNLRHHGGPDQAVLVYDAGDYDRWRAEGFAFPAPGAMGENLLLEGIDLAAVALGDHLVAGGVRLEVTAPREPCANLKPHHPDLPRLVRQTGRSGLYCRVVEAGSVAAGDPARREPRGGMPIARARALLSAVSGDDRAAGVAAARALLAEPALGARPRTWLTRWLAAVEPR